MSDSLQPWTVVYQAPLSMGFSRLEYWSGLPFPSSEDLPDPGIEPGSPELQADTLPSEPTGKSKEADLNLIFKVSSFQTFLLKMRKTKHILYNNMPEHYSSIDFFKTFFFFEKCLLHRSY